MFKGIIGAIYTTVANTNIPFTTVWNTNGNTRYNQATNEVGLLTPGYYDVTAQLNVNSTAGGVVSAELIKNGIAVPESISTFNIAAGESATFTIIDTIKVVPTDENAIANIAVRLTTVGETVNTGVLTIEKRK